MIETTRFNVETLLNEMLEWVRIESPTYDGAAVDRMQAFAAKRIEALGFAIEKIPGRDGLGGILICRRAGETTGQGVLILAHLDTVHPVGTLATALPIRRDGDKCYGPGLYDMKSGAVMALAALKAVMDAGKLNCAVTVIINGDEEIGSPTSRAVFEAEGKKHKYVLVPEPAKGPKGELTTGRHAIQRFFLTTHGRPAHSGVNNRDGRSAVRIMAQLVEEIESKSDYDHGPTYAVSVFHGGQWANCVPMTCTSHALCVSSSPAAFAEVDQRMMALNGTRNDVRIQVERGPVRPLWIADAGTMGLLARAEKIAGTLGFALPHGQHGGGSDGNFTGALGVPTLDGLGPVGHGPHTHEEHIIVSSLVPRTTLLARLIEELAA